MKSLLAFAFITFICLSVGAQQANAQIFRGVFLNRCCCSKVIVCEETLPAPMDPDELEPDENGFWTIPCGSVRWNNHLRWERVTHVKVYVGAVFWHDGNTLHTEVGAQGEVGAIRFGIHNGTVQDISATTPESAIDFRGGTGNWTSLVRDGYTDDNRGGYVLKIKPMNLTPKPTNRK